LPMLQNLPGYSTGMRIRYAVLSYSNESPRPIDDIGVNLTNNTLSSTYLSMNVLRPGLAVYGALDPDTSLLRYVDLPGSLTVRRDAFMYNYDKPYGLLMVHFHNTVGYKAKPVTLRTAPSVSLKLSATTIVHRHSAYAYVTVADNSYAYATGRVYLRQVGGGVM